MRLRRPEKSLGIGLRSNEGRHTVVLLRSLHKNISHDSVTLNRSLAGGAADGVDDAADQGGGVRAGPYRIVAWHNECDIEIQRGGQYGLHPRSRVHPVFHVSKVKPFNGESSKLQEFAADKDGDRWEVEAIIGHNHHR